MPDDNAPDYTLRSEAELRQIFGHAEGLAVSKSLGRLDRHCRDFIARSPFLVIGTMSADGRADVSPRGDPPGFVQVIDDTTLVIPDRPGNNRLDTMSNIMANPSVGLIFLIPGFDDTLRVKRQGDDRARPGAAGARRRQRPGAAGGDSPRRRGGVPALRQGLQALAPVGPGRSRRAQGDAEPRAHDPRADERRWPHRRRDGANDRRVDRGGLQEGPLLKAPAGRSYWMTMRGG
jgi:predicted pyridoxine 5'-phosphate oxidase superfamily flavin-nucleotide-binding protein